jgi:hypothetical protein
MIVHSSPPPGDIDRMMRLFDERNLWRRGQPRSFLDSTLAHEVLAALDVPDALKQYRDGEAALIDDISRSPLE